MESRENIFLGGKLVQIQRHPLESAAKLNLGLGRIAMMIKLS